MVTVNVEKLKNKNLNAFKDRYPALHKSAIHFDMAGSKLVLKNGTPVNITVDNVELYGQDSQKYCQTQLDDYFKKPSQILYENPNHCNLSPISIGLITKVAKHCVDHTISVNSQVPLRNVGFFFVFGLGLAHHIKDLVERNAAFNIVIVEPVPDFFIHSLSSVDWAEIFDLADEKEIQIHFIVGQSVLKSIDALSDILSSLSVVFVEGSHFLIHYYSRDINEIYNKFQEYAKSQFISSGFFEDEVKMMENTYHNVLNIDFRLINRGSFLSQNLPVFIVAAGPSLERDIASVKKWADRAIIVSCGTTLNLLLSNDIMPDFHIEIENVEMVYEIISKTAEKHDLKDITLVSSSTLTAGVSEFFKQTWLYARPGLSSSAFFFDETKSLLYSFPLVANAGVSFILNMGFKNIYLFGVDCGRYAGGGHHHKDHIYYDIGLDEEFEKRFDRSVPGNFGGTVETGHFFDVSRQSLASIQNVYKVQLKNCSHGARINKSLPIVSSTIDLSSITPSQKKLTLKNMEEQLPLIQKGQLIQEINWDDVCTEVEIFKKAFAELIEIARTEQQSFREIYAAYRTLQKQNHNKANRVLRIINGSMAGMIRAAAFYGNRTSDEQTNLFIEGFLDAWEELTLWMLDWIDIMFNAYRSGQKAPTFKPYDYKSLAQKNKIDLQVNE